MKHFAFMKFAGLLLIAIFLPLLALKNAYAVEIKQFKSPSGIGVYLVESYNSPIITLSFSFEGGSTQDALGKEGTSRLLSAMLDEGAGNLSSQEFQAKTEILGMELSFTAGRDYFTGTMQALTENSEQSFELLRLALNEPRFDTQPMERMRQALVKSLKRGKTSPQSVAARALRDVMFKDHPYGRPTRGTIESMGKITRDDLIAIHHKLLTKSNLVIGVVGAISPDELGLIIDKVFAKLPDGNELSSIKEAKLEFGKTVKKPMDIAQSIVSFALPGLKRSHPDFFAAYLANHILGGGTFSSRLYNEVREKRGLAYSVYSHLATYSHAAFTIVGSATSAERVDEAIAVIRAELKRMAEVGPSEEELEAAKKYVIGSYAISNLDTSGKVAGVLVAIQQIDLGIDYIDRREAIINAVKLEDVKRVAAELLKQKPTMVIVGPANS